MSGEPPVTAMQWQDDFQVVLLNMKLATLAPAFITHVK